MATYNGERFLQEQFDSLVAQTDPPCELVIGDDGSTDGTLEIIERFAKTAPFPVSVQRNPSNLGYAKNFLQTACRCAGDWIAFCDQDDVWKPTKLAIFGRVLENHPDVSLFVHNRAVCDELLHPMNLRAAGFWVSRVVPPLKGIFRVFHGCTMVFRRDLLSVVAADHRASFFNSGLNAGYGHDSHDHVISLLAYCTGNRYECPRALIFHRHHGAARTNNAPQERFGTLSRVRGVAPEYFRKARDTYEFIGGWFRDFAEYANEPYQRAFRTAALLFERRAQLFERRENLYAASGRVKRAQIFSRLLADKNYVKLLSARDHLKDLLRVLISKSAHPASHGS